MPTVKGAGDRMGGFVGSDPGELIGRVLRRSAGEKFTRSIVNETSRKKNEASKKEAWIKEGILAALYAQHVLGQQIQPPTGPMDGPVGPPPMPPPPPPMQGPPMAEPPMDPRMMMG